MVDTVDSSLVHAFLGPTSFSGKVGSTTVRVNVDTAYPFGSRLTYSITTDRDLKFKIRIPGWAPVRTSTIVVGSAAAAPIVPETATSLQVVNLKAGTTSVVLRLDTQIRTQRRFNNAILVSRGALNFALDLKYNRTTSQGLRYVLKKCYVS